MPRFLDTVNTALLAVPTAVWVVAVAVLLVGSLVAFPLARRQARAAGARAAGHIPAATRRDRALFFAAMIPAFGFLIAVLAGSQRGLVAFGRDNLHWHQGWEFLVPATLDGVGLAFGFLAFRAVRKHRSPDRAVRVAWGAATASAVINFGHETGLVGGSPLAGGYLALLSMFVMVMFHELLDQFGEGTEYIRRENPAFKLRWLTWPSNTACAWVAWRNYPVADGTPATVAAAVAHLSEVRATKRAARLSLPAAPWWVPIVPWLRVRDLGVLLTEQRTAREAERVAVQARLADAERAAERYRLDAEQAAEHLDAERAERVAVQAQLTALSGRTDRAEQDEPAERSTPNRAKTARTAEAANAPKLTDDEALRAMLRAHPEQVYEWTKREVHRITGAGFGRVDRLLAAIAEHHRSTPTEHPDNPDRAEALA